MLHELITLDKQILLWINGMNTPFLDFVMYWMSERFVWIPLYLWLIWLMWKHYGKQIWLILAGVVLMMLISDMGTVHLFKNIFHRFRPCHNAEIGPLIHLVKGHCGGNYGFISSHASNSFSVTLFSVLLLRRNYYWLPWVLFTWCSAVSFSRIYLGVHFPADVFVGACWGMLSAVIVVFVIKKFLKPGMVS